MEQFCFKKKYFFILSFFFIQCCLTLGYSQTLTVSDNTPGESPTYTFTYVTTGEIGQGSTTPNIFYMTIPSGFPSITNTIADSNLLGTNVVLKVNGVEETIDATTFGTVGGAWSGGIQMSTSGGSPGLTIPAGATIEVIVTGIIINPAAGDYTINWKTSMGSGATVESYSDSISFSALTEALTVSDNTPGESPTYTFTYVTTGEIGQGSTTPNIFYMTTPSGFPSITNTIADSNLLGTNVVLKVNGSEEIIDATTFGTVGGAWSGGIQMSTSGGSPGLAIPAGARIEVIVTGIIINPAAGNYTINWKTSMGSGATVESYSDSLSFSTLSIDENVKSDLEVKLYPNPCKETINISISNDSKIEIIDLQGKSILEKEINKGISKINLSNIGSGVYILKTLDSKNNISYKRLVRK